MFKKLFKQGPTESTPSHVVATPVSQSLPATHPAFSDELALPEVAELDSESAWAAFNAIPDSPEEEPAATQQDTFLPTACFSDTLPMEGALPVDAGKRAHASGYMDILNEIEQDQDQRKRNTRQS